VLAVFARLLDYPDELVNPVTGDVMKVSPGFCFIAAQNPPTYAGRQVLPGCISSRVVVLDVPPYDDEEVRCILKCCGLPHGCDPAVVLDALQYDAEAPNQSGAATLRHFLKLRRRMGMVALLPPALRSSVLGLGGAPGPDGVDLAAVWRQHALLHAAALYPPSLLRNPVAISGRVTFDPATHAWQFALGVLPDGPALHLRRLAAANMPHTTVDVVSTLPADAHLLLGRLALGLVAGDPLLIRGPSSYKQFCVRLLVEMLAGPEAVSDACDSGVAGAQAPPLDAGGGDGASAGAAAGTAIGAGVGAVRRSASQALEIVCLSNLSEARDLVGGVGKCHAPCSHSALCAAPSTESPMCA
jgi:hypothetical protein